METQRLISNPFLIVAVLFILAVSVAPALAADADSRQMNGFPASSTGMGSSSSNAGSEKQVSMLERGISAGSPAAGLKAESGADKTVKTEEKPQKVPWYKKWWVWAIVAVVVTVAVVATVASCGTAAPTMQVLTSGVNLLQIV